MAPGNPKRSLAILVAAIILVIGVAVLFGAYEIFGGYDVAADTPHSAALFWLADTTRRHSIAVSAASISVPLGFGSEAQVKAGASEYAEMCAQCHLGPGVERSEISQGLYPRAPELAHEGTRNPAEQFWVIKHGIKMSGMAAWGPTHSDKIIWSIAAFLQKLPDLSPAQYKAMTKDAAENHDEMRDMPGMAH